MDPFLIFSIICYSVAYLLLGIIVIYFTVRRGFLMIGREDALIGLFFLLWPIPLLAALIMGICWLVGSALATLGKFIMRLTG